MRTENRHINHNVEDEDFKFLFEHLNVPKSTSVFKTPQGYFENLNSRIVDNIQKEKIGLLNRLTAYLHVKKILAPALVTVLLAIVSVLFFIPQAGSGASTLNEEHTLLKLSYDPSYTPEIMQENALLIDNDNITKVQPITPNAINLDEISNSDIREYLKLNNLELDMYEYN